MFSLHDADSAKMRSLETPAAGCIERRGGGDDGEAGREQALAGLVSALDENHFGADDCAPAAIAAALKKQIQS